MQRKSIFIVGAVILVAGALAAVALYNWVLGPTLASSGVPTAIPIALVTTAPTSAAAEPTTVVPTAAATVMTTDTPATAEPEPTPAARSTRA